MCERVEGRKVQWQSPGHTGFTGDMLGTRDMHCWVGLWQLRHALWNLEEVIFSVLICNIKGLIHSGALIGMTWSLGMQTFGPREPEITGGLFEAQTPRPHPRPPESDSASTRHPQVSHTHTEVCKALP